MDTIKLETPRSTWDAFSALQDGRGDTAKTTRETVAKIVRDQETMIAALRERGVIVVDGAPCATHSRKPQGDLLAGGH